MTSFSETGQHRDEGFDESLKPLKITYFFINCIVILYISII